MEDLKPHRHAGRSRLVLGLFLLALGGAMLAVNLGWEIPTGWWRYFPVPLIALGLWGLVLPSRHLDRSGDEAVSGGVLGHPRPLSAAMLPA